MSNKYVAYTIVRHVRQTSSTTTDKVTQWTVGPPYLLGRRPGSPWRFQVYDRTTPPPYAAAVVVVETDEEDQRLCRWALMRRFNLTPRNFFLAPCVCTQSSRYVYWNESNVLSNAIQQFFRIHFITNCNRKVQFHDRTVFCGNDSFHIASPFASRAGIFTIRLPRAPAKKIEKKRSASVLGLQLP